MGSVQLNGQFMRNAARAIALIDITTIMIPLTFESVNFGYFLGFLDPYEDLKKDCDDPDRRAYCSWTHTAFKSLSDGKHGIYFQKQINTYAVTALIMFVLSAGMLEAYLFGILKRGVRGEVHHWCKLWIWYRFLLLLLECIVPALKVARGHYHLLPDGLYDIFSKLYRIGTFVLVLCYMEVLARNVGVVYIKPIRKPKTGSIGQDVHLLDS